MKLVLMMNMKMKILQLKFMTTQVMKILKNL